MIYVILFCLINVILSYFHLGKFNTKGFIMSFPLFILIFLISFRDYKIQVTDNEIYFYCILRRNRYFLWEDIKKFDVTKLYIRYRGFDYRIDLTINTDEGEFTFNIKNLDDEKKFLKELINRCAHNSIRINERIVD